MEMYKSSNACVMYGCYGRVSCVSISIVDLFSVFQSLTLSVVKFCCRSSQTLTADFKCHLVLERFHSACLHKSSASMMVDLHLVCSCLDIVFRFTVIRQLSLP
jgi:hypothetical protein